MVSDDNFYNVCIKYGVLVWENKQQNYYLDVAPEPIYFGIKNSPNNHFDADWFKNFPREFQNIFQKIFEISRGKFLIKTNIFAEFDFVVVLSFLNLFVDC